MDFLYFCNILPLGWTTHFGRFYEMKKFLQSLENETFTAGEELVSEAMIVAQKILVNMGLDFIPLSYVQFLKKYNGIKNATSCLCGATIDDDMDIVDKNRDMPKPQNCILLGYNTRDLLCFNYKTKQYQIVDKDKFSVLEIFDDNNLGEALTKIFNI